MPERYGRAATAEILPSAAQDSIATRIAYMTHEELDHLRGIYDAAKQRKKRGERPHR